MGRDLNVEVTLYNTAQDFEFPHLDGETVPS